MTGKVLIWLVVVGAMIFVFSRFVPPTTQAQAISYSAFLTDIDNGNVESVILKGDTIEGTLKSNTKFRTYNPETDYTALITSLHKAGVEIRGEPPDQPHFLMQLLLQ